MDTVQDGASEQEHRAVEAAVQRQPTPPFVKGFDVRFGEDHDGDPAVWVLFHLEPDEARSMTGERWAALRNRVPEMNALSSSVRAAVSDAAPGRLAYTSFVVR